MRASFINSSLAPLPKFAHASLHVAARGRAGSEILGSKGREIIDAQILF
jgi:hypothetical protein